MANMIPISTVIVGSGGSSIIQFTSIPQIYTDLVIKLSGRTDRVSTYDFVKLKFNGSATSYSERSLNGNGNAAASETNNATTYGFNYIVDAASATSNTFGNFEIYIPNYTSGNNKSYSTDAVSENNGETAFTAFTAGLWSNTSPINAISMESHISANFVQYSTATLYGIRKY
jgi:hypothetical protein